MSTIFNVSLIYYKQFGHQMIDLITITATFPPNTVTVLHILALFVYYFVVEIVSK